MRELLLLASQVQLFRSLDGESSECRTYSIDSVSVCVCVCERLASVLFYLLFSICVI